MPCHHSAWWPWTWWTSAYLPTGLPVYRRTALGHCGTSTCELIYTHRHIHTHTHTHTDSQIHIQTHTHIHTHTHTHNYAHTVCTHTHKTYMAKMALQYNSAHTPTHTQKLQENMAIQTASLKPLCFEAADCLRFADSSSVSWSFNC